MKFRTKAIIIILSLISVIGISTTMVSRILSKDIIEHQIYNHLETTAQSRALHVETFLKTEKEAIKQLSESIVIERFLSANKNDQDYNEKRNGVMRRLERTVKIEEYTYDIFVLNKNGIIIASSDKEDIGRDKHNDPYFLSGKQGAFIKDAYISSHKNRKIIAFSAPILNKENTNLLGVVVARISTEELSKITTNRTGLGETGEIYLINKDGYMITPSRFIDDIFLKQKVDTENARNCFKDVELFSVEEHEHEAVLCKNYLGGNVLGVHAHIHEMNWGLLAEISEKEAFAPIARLTHTMVLILVVLFVGAIILALLISETITKPIIELHHGTEQIIKGNLDYRVGTKSKDEIGQLSRVFDKMALNLKKSRQKLEKYSKGLERKVKEKTAQLQKQLKKSEQQRIATQNILEDFDKANEDLKSEIAQRKIVQQELIKAREVALLASKTKTEFLASMSHEIRTPMNAIIGMSELLSETSLTSDQQQYVQTFKTAGENLLNIINDILDISKVESGQIELEKIDFDLEELLEKTCEIMAIRAHEKKLDLTCYIEPQTPTQLNGDPVRLRQILLNLVGNAIKFTEKGEVLLHVDKDPKNKKSGSLLFSISDTGIGIPEEKIETIFESFTQADSSHTRKYGGTGLGLSISKRLIELMHGRMWVKSKVSKGSTFNFTAQFEIQTKSKKRKPSPKVDLKGLKTLVIDDNATNRLILRQTLTNWDAAVTEIESGVQALAELKKAKKTNNPFKLVLLDCRMPGMGGFEVAEQIQKNPDLTQTTIMMLTSDRRKGDVDKCKDLGIASYLVKPIKQSDLRNAIARALGKAKTITEKPEVKRVTASKDKRVLNLLLAEDNEDNRFLIQAYLKKTPYKIDIAEDGKIAVKKFKSNKYDLVLMDIQMPEMDGYTATKEIRAWENKKGVKPTPVIALTAYALKEEVQKSLDIGCTAHLSKPIKKAKLLQTIYDYTGEVKS
ncbi:response regulator [bacterium]|nr:response regulator [bacterium]